MDRDKQVGARLKFYDKWSKAMSYHKPGTFLWLQFEEAMVDAAGRASGELGKTGHGLKSFCRGIERCARFLYKDREVREANKPFMDGYDDPWGPTGRYGRDLPKYGGRLADETAQRLRGGTVSVVWMDECFDVTKEMWDKVNRVNNGEGEKDMSKTIDWHKPLRAFKTPGHEVVDAKVYTYKSGRQRVVWVDERVYPVDDQGRAVADVDYGPNWVHKGAQIVENVPEEKFFVGLARDTDGTYWLTDGGTPTTTQVLTSWSRWMAGGPHWIVDTRKSAAQPDPVKHDPEDWAVVYVGGDGSTSVTNLMTESQAKKRSFSDAVVRVRTTTPPADTARYVQLYRRHGQNDAWKIGGVGGRQEFLWEELGHGKGYNEYVHVKVRD